MTGRRRKSLRTYAATPYEGFSDSFANYSGLVSIEHYRNLPKAGDLLPENGRVAVVIDFYTNERPDSYTYLQLELLKQDDQWKIYSWVVDV